MEPAPDSHSVHIAVASQNPVKSAAIVGAYERLFPDAKIRVTTASVASGVSDQPMSDDETRTGALERLDGIRKQCPEADMWAGLEGGIAPEGNEMYAFAWIAVASREQQCAVRTATFPLPPAVVELIRQGVELGHANDIVFQRHNSKHQEGAIGTLTGGLIGRQELYEHAAIMAMIPMKSRLFDRHSAPTDDGLKVNEE